MLSFPASNDDDRRLSSVPDAKDLLEVRPEAAAEEAEDGVDGCRGLGAEARKHYEC